MWREKIKNNIQKYINTFVFGSFFLDGPATVVYVLQIHLIMLYCIFILF